MSVCKNNFKVCSGLKQQAKKENHTKTIAIALSRYFYSTVFPPQAWLIFTAFEARLKAL